MVLARTKLIVGLGNPGREYEKTRHNFGFMAVQRVAQGYGAGFKACRHAAAFTAEMREGGDKTVFVLPQTFMNNSGAAVGNIVRFENITPADILVVCDDLRTGFGALRLRAEGSDGGHNGLKSITAHLGTDAYARLKLGIGPLPLSLDLGAQTDFVLGCFSAAEVKDIDGILESAADCCRLWLAGGYGQGDDTAQQKEGQ